jgi:uncharacterized protein YndB with AHSA1/START domain
MMTIQTQIIIERPSSEVLEAFLQSKHTTQWWLGCETLADVHEKNIISWQWRDEAGNFLYITHGQIAGYESGIFLAVENIWQYDFTSSFNPVGPLKLLLECTPQAGHTLLIVHHTGFENIATDAQVFCKAVADGWALVLPQLKKHLESATIV